MKDLILEKYIKKAIRKALKEQEEQLKRQEKSIYLIYKFPGLKESMINLMSPSFTRYISNISVVAPKPTTFNVALTNGLDFYLTYLGNNKFKAKIKGKKYDLNNLGEVERASRAIASLLELNYTPSPEGELPPGSETAMRDNELKQDLEASGVLGGDNTPAGTPTPEQQPQATEPETPEEETT